MRPEFPSDNPELWRPRPPTVEIEILAAPEAVAVAETESVAEDEDEGPEVEVIEFAEEDFAIVENESPPESGGATFTIPPPAPREDAFHVFARTLVEVALAAGAPGRVVEMLPAMLGLQRLDARALGDDTVDALVAGGLLARSETGAVVRSESFVATAQAWRATLLGEEADFSVCTTMLDEWSASLIATLAGAPAQRESYRRELRSRGVAAFGLVEAA